MGEKESAMRGMWRSSGLWVMVAVLALAGLARAQEAKIAVKVNPQGAIKVSPTLYGIFFEEINRAGDGGLYAEMLENRSFEDNANAVNARAGRGNDRTIIVPGKVYAWSVSSGSTATLDTSKPINPKNPTALKLVHAAPAVLSNAGFKGVGLNIVDGATYLFSLYARSDAGAAPLTVRLVAKSGTVLDSRKIGGIGGDWKKFDGTLTARGGDATARLELAADGPGTLFLDMVSLFPKDTFKGRANGMRKDLAQMVADMHPAFMRFPGGCYVEGESMKIAYRWKTTIGDLAERPGHWNLWGYMSNDGLGYHEYLQFCEDIGAEPLFVVNVGMAHRDAVEMGRMDEFVQDALDSIEYANGPVSSKWGALRAQAGHPAPFGLKYMEIGNENGGPRYLERYPLFVKAIREKYPYMHLITDVWGGNDSLYANAEIRDEHDYNNPQHFMTTSTKYDGYDRKGPKVYMGEYAVTTGYGTTGNLIAALGEAAYMTGMERNSDVVLMSSYAPLFVNTSWREWSPDSIVFDQARAYGTPSYYVQAMFAGNRADLNLPLEVTSPAVAPAQALAGRFGVGTWDTQAEFKDITVTAGGQTIFQGDAATLQPPATGARAGRGNATGTWKAEGGTLSQTGMGQPAQRLFGDRTAANYTVTLKARKTGGGEGFLICFAAQGAGKSWWNLGGWGNASSAIELGGSILDQKPLSIETGKWYDVKVELQGARVRCYLDGKLIHDVTQSVPKSLFAVAGLKKAGESENLVLKVVNTAGVAQETTIDLAGAGKLEPAGKALVLTSGSINDENTIENPARVAPKETTVEGVSANFKHTFPANSVTIMTLKQAK